LHYFLHFFALFFAFRRIELGVILAFHQRGRHASQGDSSDNPKSNIGPFHPFRYVRAQGHSAPASRSPLGYHQQNYFGALAPTTAHEHLRLKILPRQGKMPRSSN
jgi:hypothetical protein